ncbi:LysR family transcriptional regulator [bacterium]|nr:LysR family transcriptional regulator [bacterium]
MLGEVLRRKGVSVERLVGLCEIKECGGIMAAARGEPSKQSLLSRQIKELENALGYPLMDRSSSPSQLNPSGEALAKTVGRFISDFDRIAAVLSKQTVPLRIAASESLVLSYIIPILKRLGLSGTRSVQLLNMRSSESSRALTEGKVDLAVSHSLSPSDGIKITELASYGLRLVGKKSAGVQKWSNLERRALATLTGSGRLRQAVDRLVGEYPDGPFIALECTSHTQLLAACETLGAIAVIPEIALFHEPAKRLGSCPIAELRNERFSVSCGWNVERAKDSNNLQLLIQEILK